MPDFSSFDLPESLQHCLKHIGFTTPTPIQEQTIPLALEGRDILGTAQTGTGKTAAFAIPLVAKLRANPKAMALVMLPTRELALQVEAVIKQLAGGTSPVKTALLIGGDSMVRQLDQLRNRPRIIVGTPGRINDHLSRGSLNLHFVNLLVLDETDRMLDMGFGVQIDKILRFMTQTRQTLMFSATLPKEILKLSEKYLNNPERISIGATNVAAAQIKQEVIRTDNKYDELITQLNKRDGSVIIFVKTKYGAERLAGKLSKQDFSADTIHGDLRQNKREKVIRNFREMKFRILVATDIAARGLDIPHIEHVINYDLPQMAEDFIHRIGRTARAGAEGSAISFVSADENGKWKAISRLMKPGVKEESPRKYDKQKTDIDYSARKKPFGRFNKFQRGNDYRKEEESPAQKSFNDVAADYENLLAETDGGNFERKPFKKEGFRKDDRKDGSRKDFKKGSFRKDGFKKPFKQDGFKKDGEFKTRGEYRKDGEFKARENRGERKFENSGERPQRRSFGTPGGGYSRPRDERNGRSERNDRPRSEFRKDVEFKPRGERREGGFKKDGFKKPFRKDGEFKPRGEFRKDGEFKPRGDRKPFGDRPRGDFKKPFRKDGEFKPRGERSEGGFKKPFKKDGFKKGGFNKGKSFGGKRDGGSRDGNKGGGFGFRKRASS